MNHRDAEYTEKKLEPQIAIASPSPQSRLQGCVKACGVLLFIFWAIVGVLAIGLFLSYQYSYNQHITEVNNHRTQWEQQQIQDYNLTIDYVSAGGGYQIHITIIDGEVIAAENTSLNSNSADQPLESYSQYTVENLFNSAEKCFQLCQVQYDATYGHPTYIGGGFIEFSWIEISLEIP